MKRPVPSSEAARGRLQVRPAAPLLAPDFGDGVHPVACGVARPAELLVPGGLAPGRSAPLILMLHGAGGHSSQVLPLLAARAEAHGLLVLAPNSQGPSWDVIHGRFGPDVAAIDRALAWTFERCAVDPRRVAIGGFSDGASYALSLGLANGDLFSDILAFSPGFAAPADHVGTPRVFISHGRRDTVLPIERCGAPLSRRLAASGYDVDYREFADGHIVPPDLVDAAVARFLGGTG